MYWLTNIFTSMRTGLNICMQYGLHVSLHAQFRYCGKAFTSLAGWALCMSLSFR